ncbi:MAG: hypothetical protein U0936_12555 [Planctomycetaceae bacterium]
MTIAPMFRTGSELDPDDDQLPGEDDLSALGQVAQAFHRESLESPYRRLGPRQYRGGTLQPV